MSYTNERWKCDRNGGVLARYMRAPKRWWCDRCGEEQNYRGHRCQECRRRVCCQCFHHDLGTCPTCRTDFITGWPEERGAEKYVADWKAMRDKFAGSIFAVLFLCLILAPQILAQYPSEQLHIPYVVHSAPYLTDLTLTNLTADRVSISYTFRSANSHDADPNAPLLQQRVDVRYLNPRQSLTVEVGEIGISGQGQLVINACKEFIPCGDAIDQTSDPINPHVLQNFNPAAIRKISASVRIYSVSATGGTHGDSMTAIPWYALPGLDGAAGMNRVQIVGIRNEGHFTTQIGLNNASVYSTTVLTAILHDGSGVERGRRWTETLGPFESVKRSAEEMFGADAFAANRLNRTAAIQSAWVEVQQTAVMPNELAARTVGCESGCPRFYAWASVTDSKSLDFSIVEPSFEMVEKSSEVATALKETRDGAAPSDVRLASMTATLSGPPRLMAGSAKGAGTQARPATSEVVPCIVVGPFRADASHSADWYKMIETKLTGGEHRTIRDVPFAELWVARAVCSGGGQ